MSLWTVRSDIQAGSTLKSLSRTLYSGGDVSDVQDPAKLYKISTDVRDAPCTAVATIATIKRIELARLRILRGSLSDFKLVL